MPNIFVLHLAHCFLWHWPVILFPSVTSSPPWSWFLHTTESSSLKETHSFQHLLPTPLKNNITNICQKLESNSTRLWAHHQHKGAKERKPQSSYFRGNSHHVAIMSHTEAKAICSLGRRYCLTVSKKHFHEESIAMLISLCRQTSGVSDLLVCKLGTCIFLPPCFLCIIVLKNRLVQREVACVGVFMFTAWLVPWGLQVNSWV